VALGVMKAIKQALDPHNLMNPGKVIASWSVDWLI
jgi:FAD/FMN-containing dehydrogenase